MLLSMRGEVPFPWVAGVTAAAGDLFVRVASVSDTGKVRAANEDAYTVVEPTDPETRERRGLLVVVADGMGGALGGATASRLVVETVERVYYEDAERDIPSALEAAIREANAVVHAAAQSDPSLKGMGSTCTAAVICNGLAYVAHVGDSRAYLVKGDQITQLTRDHSHVGELLRRGVLTPELAARHPQRGVLLRCIGPRAEVKVDLIEAPIELADQDRLVLCSDGLTGMASDEEIREQVAHHRPDTAVHQLLDLANGRGGDDNITVHVVAVTRRSIVVSSTQMPIIRPQVVAARQHGPAPPTTPARGGPSPALILLGFALLGAVAGVGAWLLFG